MTTFKRQYTLTRAANSDLQQIGDYTFRQWGELQFDRYLLTIHGCFNKISEDKIVPSLFSKRFPKLFVTRCEHHFIFYFHQKPSHPSIIAVLHKRMDLFKKLAARLPS